MYEAVRERDTKPRSMRKIVLIDKSGMVTFRNEGLKVGDDGHWKEMLEAVKKL